MSAVETTDLKQPSSNYEVPIFEGHTKATVARFAAYIHTEYEQATFCRADVTRSLEYSPAEISKLCRKFIEEGFLYEHDKVPDAHRAGRPIVPVRATDKLAEYVANVPSWREKAVFFRVQKCLGYSEDETMSYLIASGAHTLGVLNN